MMLFLVYLSKTIHLCSFASDNTQIDSWLLWEAVILVVTAPGNGPGISNRGEWDS